MFDPKKLLVVIHLDEATYPALDKALAIARSKDVEIVLLSCEHTQYLVEGYYFDAAEVTRLRTEYLQECKEQLEKIAKPIRENGLTISTLALWAYPEYETITKQALELDADLVIQHIGRHGALSRMFLTHTDWQLVRTCPKPLLLVKEHSWSSAPKIIGAVDPKHARYKPSGLDHKILEFSIDLAKVLAGTAYALHAFHPIALSGVYPDQAEGDHEMAFNELMADFSIDKDRQLLVEGAPEIALYETQQDLDAEVVVMGAISRSFFNDVFVGNTTEKAMDYLKCDVLTLKPNDFKMPRN